MVSAGRVVGASVTGPSHVKRGDPCQDAHGWAQLPDGSLLLVVADGAGSASHGDWGARAAVWGAIEAALHDEAAVAAESEDWWQRVLRYAAAARQQLLWGAEAHGLLPRQLATTLILCLWAPGFTSVAHVGDGACLLRHAGRDEPTWELFSGPAPTEYVNETDFLSQTDWESRVHLNAWTERLSALLLLTDGSQRAALRKRHPVDEEGAEWEPFVPFVEPIYRHLSRTATTSEAESMLQAFLDSAKMSEHSDDDKTILLFCAGE